MSTLVVGIARNANIKNRRRADARERARPAPEVPALWFSSPESFAKSFSSENIQLYRLIAKERPKGYAALEKLTGIHRRGIAKRLRALARCGLIEIERTEDGDVIPHPLCTKLILEFQLLPAGTSVFPF